jgi:hypothetical protein
MDIPRLKVPHDTPPLRGFQPLVSLILDFRVSSPWKQLLNILGFGADMGRFWARLHVVDDAHLKHDHAQQGHEPADDEKYVKDWAKNGPQIHPRGRKV